MTMLSQPDFQAGTFIGDDPNGGNGFLALIDSANAVRKVISWNPATGDMTVAVPSGSNGGGGTQKLTLAAVGGVVVSTGSLTVSVGGATFQTGVTVKTGGHFLEGQDNQATSYRGTVYGAAGFHVYRGCRAGGTFGAATAITSGQGLVGVYGSGWDGSAFQDGAGISVTTTETWSGTARGSQLAFATTANGTTALTTRWLIRQDGAFVPSLDNAYNVGSSSSRVATGYFVGLAVGAASSAARAITALLASGTPGVRIGFTTDTASFSEWITSSVNAMAWSHTASTGAVTIDVHGIVTDGASSSNIRFHRLTNTSGVRTVQFLRGDNTTTVDAQVGSGTTSTFFGAGQATGFSQNFGLGTNSPSGAFHSLRSNGVNQAISILETWYDSTSYSQIWLRRARAGATTNPATQSVVQSADVLAGIFWQGWDGSAYANSAGIQAVATENFGGAAHGTFLQFSTTPSGSTALTGRWQIRESGHLFAVTDNAIDIGANGGNRPRSIYAAASILSPNFNLTTTKTPTGTADGSGSTGDIAYDASFIYLKTSGGWKRAALSTF